MTATTRIRIALIEDDLDLQQSTEEYLLAAGYSVWSVSSAEGFYRQLAVSPVDLVVLDIGLPGEDGISVTEHLRELPQIRVIVVSAHECVNERIKALNAGADRYLVKPVEFTELLANIEASLQSMGLSALSQSEINDAPLSQAWCLDSINWQLIDPKKQSIKLTSSEFILLRFLQEANGGVVARSFIIKEFYGTRIRNGGDRLDLLLTRLRKKSTTTLFCSLPIKTLRNVGYMFSAPLQMKQ